MPSGLGSSGAADRAFVQADTFLRWDMTFAFAETHVNSNCLPLTGLSWQQGCFEGDLRHAGQCPAYGLLAKRSDDDISGFGAAVILLPGDEVAVTDCETPPQTSLDVVGPELFHFVLDAPRHDMGAPRQLAGRPDRLIDEVLLDVGEAGDGATLHQRVAV